MAGAAAVATVFGTAMAVKGQMDARDSAQDAARQEKRMAAEEAAAIEAETAESVRRAKDKAAEVEGESRARAAASGAEVTGSLSLSLDDMAEEHTRQIEWMAKAGASRARLATQGGVMRADARRSQADQLKYQMWGTVAKGAGQTYTYGSDAGWWG